MKIKLSMLCFVFLASCTNARIASYSALGKEGNIKCYSGGILVYEGIATGRIASLSQSDGWEFEEKGTGSFIRISGTCVIRN